MSQETTNAALRFFFETFLTAPQKAALQQSHQAVEVRLGEYKSYAGSPVPVLGGGTIKPRFAIEVSRQSLPLRNGIPDASGAGVGGNPTRAFLLWLRDIADVLTDSQAEIERIMHNLDYFVGAGGTRNAAAWARAIATHPNRGSLKRNLFEYPEVPPEFTALAGNIGEFRQTLYHFFTFTEDGEYYPRWSGAGRSVPGDFTARYKERHIIEYQLARYDTYLYSVVPTSFLTASPPPDAAFREIVWGFLWGGEDGNTPTGVRVLHTVDRAAGDVEDYFDFVCFEAEEGLRVAMRPSARGAIDEGLANFLGELPEDPTERARVVRASSLTTDHPQPLVKMFATIRGNPQLPAGVLSLGSGEVRTLLVPPDKVEELAALDEVDEVRGPRPLYLRLTEVATMVRRSALEARIAAAKRGGEGVVIGVIDSGLDAQHPAFAGRVLGVWEQGNPMGPAPAVAMNQGVSGLLDAIGDVVRTVFFGDGTEFTGSTVTNARDLRSHGTHVTGIAAGAEVTGANRVPPGMAPKARIVVVQSGRPAPDPNDVFSERNQGLRDFDVVTGLMYIREKARQVSESTPVVVNMSFGSHDHAHDGTDTLNRALKNAVMDGPNYIPGLVLVAAAGNERTDHRHLQRTVAAGGNAVLSFDFTPGAVTNRSPLTEVITVWATNPKAGNAKLDARIRTRRATPSAVATADYSQSATQQPTWETKWGDGVHIGTSFGPPDPENGDFNLRVRFQTALALLPDPSGPITIPVGGTPT
ncbi:MAG: S8 family serine peptidase, partial [Gammaproteobacteria bacterium]